MEKSYWHICTDGLAREIIFKDVKDYIFGMNGVPALSLSYDITVLAFCLMSNHVHLNHICCFKFYSLFCTEFV